MGDDHVVVATSRWTSRRFEYQRLPHVGYSRLRARGWGMTGMQISRKSMQLGRYSRTLTRKSNQTSSLISAIFSHTTPPQCLSLAPPSVSASRQSPHGPAPPAAPSPQPAPASHLRRLLHRRARMTRPPTSASRPSQRASKPREVHTYPSFPPSPTLTPHTDAT